MSNEEKEILSIHTGLEINDEFFTQQQFITKDDLKPCFFALLEKCDGVINKPGIYGIKLQICKLI